MSVWVVLIGAIAIGWSVVMVLSGLGFDAMLLCLVSALLIDREFSRPHTEQPSKEKNI